MKRRLAALASFAFLLVGLGLWVEAQQADSRSLPRLLPAGAVLYLEARDLHSVLGDWNGSVERTRWLRSENFSAVAESRLLQRLLEAKGEFASASGLPIGMNLLDEVAGQQSALAFYDVSYHLRFVYLTRLEPNRLEGSSLWRGRAGYQSRTVAGIPFYLKTENGESGTRTVAFAAYNGWLIVATDEAKMAETLVLLGGNAGRSLDVEPWFQSATAGKQPNAELTVAYDVQALLRTPQFRTYWIQRNASELKPFSSGFTELHRTPAAFEETRVLLRTEASTSMADSAIGEALRFVPASTSFYRATALPDAAQLAAALHQVVFSEKLKSRSFDESAPSVSASAGTVGSESDLEVLLNQPPFERQQTDSVAPLVQLLITMQPVALLHVQATSVTPDGVFILPNSGLVVICRKVDTTAWEAAWTAIASRATTNELDPLSYRFEGNALIVSRLALTRGPESGSLSQDTAQVTAYHHTVEWPHYKRLFRIVDSSERASFFSGNLRSLGDSLPDLDSVEITTRDAGDRLLENAKYHWRAQTQQ